MIASAPPRGLVAATAPPEYRGLARDGVRMLVTDRRIGSHAHAHFYDLPELLRAGDLLVVNDSATLPAALTACRANGTEVRVHVSTMIDAQLWTVEPRAPVVAGETLVLPGGASVTLLTPVDPGRPRLWYASFRLGTPMYAYLARFGEPISYAYLDRSYPLREYQTFFARSIGSSEMPSAARPFTRDVVERLRARGVEIVSVTLHCGVASFEAPERPGIERFIVSGETADRVNAARRAGRRVVAVGTTVVRALEAAATVDGVVATAGWTDLFIDERYPFSCVDALLSGFHDAGATHVSMLSAFMGSELLQAAYAKAAEGGYAYHEFGDVHLIE
ncbi:MAG TPA: S-adenosylmethionine:tRNA ribosyltransferase-isomerase [Candidatus Baltobacteraceae bacterium]|nr:S-adenosylmethionine:tRNA ribosyltransferase-isomerase [Candidatus Baltobacteraceae bacterium]